MHLELSLFVKHPCSLNLVEDKEHPHCVPNMEEGGIGTGSDAVDEKADTRTTCAKHGGRQIEYLCRNHQEVGCSDCLVLEHRACKNIARLSDVCTDSSTGVEIEAFKKQLRELVERIAFQIEFSEDYSLKATADSDNATKDVDSFVEDVCAIVKYLGKEAKDQIDTQKQENLSRLGELRSKGQLLKDFVEAMETTFKGHEARKETTEMVILMKQERKTLRVWGKESKAIADQTVLQQVTFKADTQVSKYVKGATKIGRLEKGIQYKPKEVVKDEVLPYALDARRTISASQPSDAEMRINQLTDTTEVSFIFKAGIQKRSHPKPGTAYNAATFKCCLRKDGQGQIIRDKLRRVFDSKLLFTVGDDDRIVCNVELFNGWVYGWFFILTSDYLDYEKRVLTQLTILQTRCTTDVNRR